MRVVVAPDKFKGSATASDVAAAVARGITSAAPWAEVCQMPIADGGDGTLEAALGAGFKPVHLLAAGPTGVPGLVRYAELAGTALVEMASVCGQSRLPGGRTDPCGASSRGLGEVMRAALDDGHRRLAVGIGGSASTDGGAGMLAALGARILDDRGRPVADGGAALLDVTRLDLSGLHPAICGAEIVIACDVDNPLVGPEGAAAVFGPQKGAGPGEVDRLESALVHWADAVARTTGADRRSEPGAGAAGGVGFSALAALGARLRSGAELVLDLVGFVDAAGSAGLVVVGEGCIDSQTLRGKAPMGAARMAVSVGAEVVAVCGTNRVGQRPLDSIGIRETYACVDRAPDAATSMADPLPLLEEIGVEIAIGHLSAP